MTLFSRSLIISISMLLISCESNRLDVQPSNIEPQIQIKRLDQDIFTFKPDELAQLKMQYGDFLDNYINGVLNIGAPNDEAVVHNIKGFRSDRYIRELRKEVDKKYNNIDFIEKELSGAFSYYQHHFPEKSIPQLVTCISGFNYSVVVTDSTLGIGLDMFLGADSEFYPKLGIPKYRSRLMTKDHLPIEAIKGWVMTEFPFEESKPDLLEKMVYEGKILYVMDACFREKYDSLKIGFSLDQLIWCHQNEFNLWAHFVDKQLLYSKNQSDIVQYTGEGPFTNGFDKASPARTGSWLGWQIVRAFMDENPKISLKQLMEMKNAQKLLTDSRYKPKG